MQLADRTGIACDLCGTSYRQDFSYYSLDFRPVAVINNQRSGRDLILQTKINFSLDLCAACYAQLSNTVVQHYSTIMSPKRRALVQTICEVTGEILAGTYTYYHCLVTGVSVRFTGQPTVCVKCKARTTEAIKACPKCQGTTFTKPANIKTENDVLEFNVSEATYRGYIARAENVRKVAGEWATKS